MEQDSRPFVDTMKYPTASEKALSILETRQCPFFCSFWDLWPNSSLRTKVGKRIEWTEVKHNRRWLDCFQMVLPSLFNGHADESEVASMIQWLNLRPTFEIPIKETRDEAILRIDNECKRVAEPRLFFVHGEYGELHLPTDQHRLWSPHLSFYVSHEGDQTIVRGRFAPRLEVWTFIWILYLAMAFLALFAMVMEFSKWSIGEESWWRWGALLSLISIAMIYIVANVGQQWSHDQMAELRNRLEKILIDTELVK